MKKTLMAMAAAALAAQAAQAAEPSPEALKAGSGVRFSETAGLGYRPQAVPVSAELGSAERPALKFSDPQTRRALKESAVPSPAGAPTEGEPRKASIGRRLLRSGLELGAVIATGVAAMTSPAFAAFALAAAAGGALAGGVRAARENPGSKRAVFGGAVTGFFDVGRAPSQVGYWLGDKIGAAVEKIFRR